MTIVPEQWHVYVVDLGRRVRTKPGKLRPCVAIQPTAFAAAGLPSTVQDEIRRAFIEFLDLM